MPIHPVHSAVSKMSMKKCDFNSARCKVEAASVNNRVKAGTKMTPRKQHLDSLY